MYTYVYNPEKDESRKPPIKKVTQPTVLSTLAVEDVLDHCQPTSRASDPQNEEADPELDVLDPASDGFFRALQETCAEDVTFKDQFSKEKEEVVDEEAPKDIDTFLPGWNAWTGPGLEAKDEERRKRRIIPAPKVKREDSEKSHVIIKRRVNNDFKQHLVKSIPFPYNTPEQFEAFIAQPISREWVTEEMHKEFTRPKVTVQAGRIIKPIAQSAAILRDKDVERLAKKKKDV
ncbi:unnamed protein product [Calicophoron daubneyi]|uniref:Uncharacterized protein n=1 Tax=Calicophoron daubneyi TaxID=300641 RepID=A0AAV2THX7_CALDB